MHWKVTAYVALVLKRMWRLDMRKRQINSKTRKFRFPCTNVGKVCAHKRSSYFYWMFRHPKLTVMRNPSIFLIWTHLICAFQRMLLLIFQAVTASLSLSPSIHSIKNLLILCHKIYGHWVVYSECHYHNHNCIIMQFSVKQRPFNRIKILNFKRIVFAFEA